MSSSETITIDLRNLANAPIDLQLTLGDSYFAALDQDEILGGEVHVAVSAKAMAGDSFLVSVKAEGEVRVACDRCLEEVTLPIETTEQMVLRYGDESDAADEAYDVTVIPFSANTYNLSWDIYEFIALALPIQRTHADGECPEEMTQYIVRSEEL